MYGKKPELARRIPAAAAIPISKK